MVAVRADDEPRASANYKDLSQAPDRFVARTPAEMRAKRIADTIAKNWFSFQLALNIPKDPADFDDFVTRVQGTASLPAVKDYVAEVRSVLATTQDLLDQGADKASDDEVAKYVDEADRMRALEIKVSYDNPDPDGAELNAQFRKPVLDSKTRHAINDLATLGKTGVVKLNDARADQYATLLDAVVKSRLHDIYDAAKIADPGKRTEDSKTLLPLVHKEINGALWQYRELNTLIVSGLGHPDPNAIEVFNRVLDELDANIKDERHAL